MTKKELQNLEELLKSLNTEEVEGNAQWLPGENQFEPGFPDIRDLRQKKLAFSFQTAELQDRITRELKKMYGDNAPLITLQAPAKPLPKSQRNMRTVGQGENRRRIGGASQELNENVNWLLAYSEKKILDNLSKTIEASKNNYISARNATVAYNFNVQLSKITLEQWTTLVENYNHNQILLDKLIDEQAQKDIKKESVDISKLSDTEIISDLKPGVFSKYSYKSNELYANTIEDAVEEVRKSYDKNNLILKQQNKFEFLKQQALAKKAELEK